MSKVSDSPSIGRQSQLPLTIAFKISLNSLRIRFWRSMVTAAGIFLGIAFLTTVLTQWLMQWPLPEKINAGYVRIDGQVNGPGDICVWKEIPVSVGVGAGIPANVVKYAAAGRNTFQLAEIVQGQIDAKRADKNLARVNREWEGLKNVKPSEYADANKDFSVGDAVKVGVPEDIADHLAGDAKLFKGGALADAIKAHPIWMAIWRSRVRRFEIFRSVDQNAIKKLADANTITLGDVLAAAKNPTKDADKTSIMLVNTGNRKIAANITNKFKAKSLSIRLKDGDNILVPDRNVKYRTYWLVVMSLLVCTVGITNSMLMAVTERFKEIGTMKCLGALDKFVVTLFMLESGMMGIVASVLGWLVGFLAIILIAGFTKGWGVVGNMEPLQIFKTFIGSVVIGMLLTFHRHHSTSASRG